MKKYNLQLWSAIPENSFLELEGLSLVSSFWEEETNSIAGKIYMPVLLCTHLSLAIIRWKPTWNFLPFHLETVLGNFQDHVPITSQHASRAYSTTDENKLCSLCPLSKLSSKGAEDGLSFSLRRREGRVWKIKLNQADTAINTSSEGITRTMNSGGIIIFLSTRQPFGVLKEIDN